MGQQPSKANARLEELRAEKIRADELQICLLRAGGTPFCTDWARYKAIQDYILQLLREEVAILAHLGEYGAARVAVCCSDEWLLSPAAIRPWLAA